MSEKKEIIEILRIGVTRDNFDEVHVVGNLNNKEGCLRAIAEAIKAICNYKESKIIKARTMPKMDLPVQ